MKKIYPDVLSNSKVDIQFVPVRTNTGQYIPGTYVIRVMVEYGERDRVYYFKEGKEDFYYFRREKQILIRSTNAALDEQVNRARKPLEIPPKLHEGYCLKPEIGRPIYGDPVNGIAQSRINYDQEELDEPFENKEKRKPVNFKPKG